MPLIEYICIIDGFYDTKYKKSTINEEPIPEHSIISDNGRNSRSSATSNPYLQSNTPSSISRSRSQVTSPNLAPSASYSSNLLSKLTNFYRYPAVDSLSYPLPASIIDFMRPESCSAFHWKISENKHNLCDMCKISGGGVSREHAFILTLTDKEINQTRYAIIETISAAKVINKFDLSDSNPITFAIISEHPFYNKYKDILNILKKIYVCDFDNFENLCHNLLKIPEPDSDGKFLIRLNWDIEYSVYPP